MQDGAGAVASGVLCLIERLVGASEKGWGVIAADSFADADAFGYDCCASAGGLRKNEEKLVAAEAAEDVVGAKPGGDCRRNVTESGIAGSVAFGIVVRF